MVKKNEDRIELGTVEARGGESSHVTRYVLPISLALIVILFIVVLVIYR